MMTYMRIIVETAEGRKETAGNSVNAYKVQQ